MIFGRRGSRGPDPHLEGRVQLFFIGAGIALLGIAFDSKILVGSSLVVLIGGVFLHLFLGRSSAPEEGDPPAEGGHEENGHE
jgi:hypothetical protein